LFCAKKWFSRHFAPDGWQEGIVSVKKDAAYSGLILAMRVSRVGQGRMYQSLIIERNGQATPVGSAMGSAPGSPHGSGGAVCRVFDIVVAVLAIIFTAPLLIAVAIAVKLADGGPALFGHQRMGLGGRPFRCLKFRSMLVDSDERLAAYLAIDPVALREWQRDQKLRCDPRVTPVGDFIRKSSLDELPQLFNVLRGEMSIVGPRPIVADEARRYGARYAWYCRVRPGITGFWQVSGRNNVSYRRRVAMDTLYAKNKSLGWDVKLVFLTVPAVLFAKGSY
jgi:exopolysaccharide production protein ExoY